MSRAREDGHQLVTIDGVGTRRRRLLRRDNPGETVHVGSGQSVLDVVFFEDEGSDYVGTLKVEPID